jgi:hypothetical protein
VNIQFFPSVDEALFSPTYVFGTFVENQMAVAVEGFISGSFVLFH